MGQLLLPINGLLCGVARGQTITPCVALSAGTCPFQQARAVPHYVAVTTAWHRPLTLQMHTLLHHHWAGGGRSLKIAPLFFFLFFLCSDSVTDSLVVSFGCSDCKTRGREKGIKGERKKENPLADGCSGSALLRTNFLFSVAWRTLYKPLIPGSEHCKPTHTHIHTLCALVCVQPDCVRARAFVCCVWDLFLYSKPPCFLHT